MIFEHEIPNGSHLYFGKIANKKRQIESKISDYLLDSGFEEIITPNFSYSQHQSIDNTKELIMTNDEQNNIIALRADSTLDVVRIITKRLGKSTNNKKWFYIQPVFSYPSHETYQIGCEWIGHNNISNIINLNIKILDLLNIHSTVQIANIKIPRLISKNLNIDLDLFKNSQIDDLLNLDIKWLTSLLYAQTINDLINIIQDIPEFLKDEIKEIITIASHIEYKNIKISPLYYGAWKYYNNVYYRIIKDNLTIAKGGGYESNKISSLGFSIYTDNLLKIVKV
jgi:histidyl-tRNA synthetase